MKERPSQGFMQFVFQGTTSDVLATYICIRDSCRLHFLWRRPQNAVENKSVLTSFRIVLNAEIYPEQFQNIRPLHLHDSVCFEERGEYITIVAILIQWHVNEGAGSVYNLVFYFFIYSQHTQQDCEFPSVCEFMRLLLSLPFKNVLNWYSAGLNSGTRPC